MHALKSFLNISLRTPNDMVYGDTGRFPLSVNAKLRCVKFWLKILEMDEYRLPHRVYKMMYMSRNEKSWAAKVKNILMDCGCIEIWSNQRVPNKTAFLKIIREKLISTFHAEWKLRISSSDRYSFYNLFKTSFGTESYLHFLDKKVF